MNHSVIAKGIPGYRGEAWLITAKGRYWAVSHIDTHKNETVIFPADDTGQMDIDFMILGSMTGKLDVKDYTFPNMSHEEAIEAWLSRD